MRERRDTVQRTRHGILSLTKQHGEAKRTVGIIRVRFTVMFKAYRNSTLATPLRKESQQVQG